MNQNKENYLICLYTNATSLNPEKLLELSIIAAEERPHVILITETWYGPTSVSTIEGYVIFRNDRDGIGGGTAIYVRNDIISGAVSDHVLTSSRIEQSWCTATINYEQILIGCIYRPPRCQKDENDFKEMSHQVNTAIVRAKRLVDAGKYNGLLIAGDFNYPNIEWHEEGGGQVNGAQGLTNNFFDMLNDNFLHQSVAFPTFLQADGTSKNALDLIISESGNRINHVKCGAPLGNTIQGHFTLRWEYNLASHHETKFRSIKYSLRKGDYTGLNVHFEKLNWEVKLHNKNADEMYDMFCNEIYEALEKYLPKLSLNPIKSKHKPWINGEVLRLASKKKRLFFMNLATDWENSELVSSYRRTNRLVGKQSRFSKIEYERELANDKKNPKRLFSYINQHQKVKEQINSIKTSDGEITTDATRIANVLNQQFQSVFVREGDEELPNFESRTNSKLENINIYAEDVAKKLEALNENKSAGADKLHPYVLKKCARTLAKSLTRIFEASLREGVVPKAWREANVTPLPKSGCRLDPANYRPISLTSVPCKILERIVRDQIVDHLNRHNLISLQQHGFVKNKSCLTNLLETMDNITQAIAGKNPIDLVFLDFAKAFDKVPHRRLIHKLQAYGIQGPLLNWIKAFITNRTQRVVMGSSVSDTVEVTSGVPQGSVLGPLLFLIYINDLPERITNPCKLFADDSKIIAKLDSANSTQLLQEDINAILHWTRTWLMELNTRKCKVMHIGRTNPKANYTMKDNTGSIQNLSTTELERDLGVLISSDLKFSAQVSKCEAQANKMLGVLKNTFMNRDPEIWKKLYMTYVRPHMEYAVQAWNPYQKCDKEKLEKVQRRATKIPSMLRRLDYKSRCEKLDLTFHEERRTRGDLIEMFKIVKGFDQVKWQTAPLIIPARANHREQYRREIVRNCQQRYNFFSNRITSVWNALPFNVVSATTVNSFKARLDEYYKCST